MLEAIREALWEEMERDPTVFLLARGKRYDHLLMKNLFPDARKVYEGKRGHVWRRD